MGASPMQACTHAGSVGSGELVELYSTEISKSAAILFFNVGAALRSS